MNNQIVPFNFENRSIRTVAIDQVPWWVGKDVCDVLGIANNRDAISRLEDYEKLTSAIPTLGQNKRMWLVNESGVYSLVLTSNKPEAKRFKWWLTTEVLPKIRKTGRYGTVDSRIEEMEAKIELLGIAAENARLREENERLNRRYICTPDDAQEILQLHKAGFKVSQIAYKTKKGKTRIKKVIAETESQPGLFDDEPSESFGGPLEAPEGRDGGGA